MLGTRTFREGGVMIRWLWPLGRMWAPAIMPLYSFVLSVVVSLGFYTPIHYILVLNVRIDECTFIYVVVMLHIC